MKNTERLFYFALVFGLYCAGRYHSENRATVQSVYQSKKVLKAITENRLDDAKFFLSDNISSSTFQSYSKFSFGPNLWQKPIPQEKIKVEIVDVPTHKATPQKQLTPPPQPTPAAVTPLTTEVKTTAVESAPINTAPSEPTTNPEVKQDEVKTASSEAP